MSNHELPFKYVGNEKYLTIYETKPAKCSSCGSSVPKEINIGKTLLTCVDIEKVGEKIKFYATLHGHKILSLEVEEPCRWNLE